MKKLLGFSTLAVIAAASPCFAGLPAPSPAPLLGGGLSGLAVFAAAGVGYLALRAHRQGKD